jgi:hypothetical protein
MSRFSPSPPDISAGALELLRIAKANDNHDALARNAALLTVLEFAQTLLSAVGRENDGAIKRLLALEELPSCFVEFVAACLRTVRDQQQQRFQDTGNRNGVLFVADFDRPAMQAFAETMAELIWIERSAVDFDGPRLNIVFQRLKDQTIEHVWFEIVKNYIGNLLQHYFSAARIREQVRDLPVTIEGDLRLVEAARIAEYAQALGTQTGEAMGARHIMGSLERALKHYAH